MTPPPWYREAKHKAPRLCENQTYPYNFRMGEFCPGSLDRFLKRHAASGSTLWEPFAGHTSLNQTIDICAGFGVRLVAHDISPIDERVVQADSTRVGPGLPINGVIFHPPYYGAGCVFSDQEGELSSEEDLDSYLAAINRCIDRVDEVMEEGYIYLVARTYPVKGKSFSLDWVLTNEFLSRGYEFEEALCDTPDWIVYLSKSA